MNWRDYIWGDLGSGYKDLPTYREAQDFVLALAAMDAECGSVTMAGIVEA